MQATSNSSFLNGVKLTPAGNQTAIFVSKYLKIIDRVFNPHAVAIEVLNDKTFIIQNWLAANIFGPLNSSEEHL